MLLGICAVLMAIGIIGNDWYTTLSAPIKYVQAMEEPEPKEVLIQVEVDWTEKRIEKEIRDTFPEMPNTMVAIAKCENGWSKARGYVFDQQSQHTLSYGQERSFGIFQIHEPDWHDKAIELGLENYQTDPKENIQMARYIFDTQGIKAWTCFNKDLYQKHL